MALHYNLAKVYAISENDTDFVTDIVTLFVSEIPGDLLQMKHAINEKDHVKVYGFAHKMKPTFDLLGMTVAHEEIVYIENWTKSKGKRKEVKDTFKSIEGRIEKAVKEISKDFNL